LASAHPGKTARPGLEVGHADCVLVGHAKRELPRRFSEKSAGAIAVLPLDLAETLEPREKFAGIVEILIVD
jgi:hypothetical protein